jgi:predicted HicB family RNase H-like nuclease
VSDFLKYKDYQGSVEYSSDDRLFFGRVLFIDSLLMFHGSSVEEIEKSFKETVESYIEYCKKHGKPLNKPYSGTFNVRVGSEMHKQAAHKAALAGVSLNQYLINCIQKDLGLLPSDSVTPLNYMNEIMRSYMSNTNIANNPQTQLKNTMQTAPAAAAVNFEGIVDPYLNTRH